MHSREIRRKRRDMMIVLLRVIRQRLFAQFPARPREIKRMFQEVLLRDVSVDLIEMLIHKFLSDNSPAFQRWVKCDIRRGVPKGRKEFPMHSFTHVLIHCAWRRKKLRKNMASITPNEYLSK